ncbi:GNAT family N-acetyltransferase [Methylosinus sp. LW4]|uniref:GNAT family N-acetyltransferase n=1 Tax=Methylosinus sp. LW4 TaxID=136993 RepID=UPI0004784198|nr:GNAT family N-acetyltransferase [Methylosinus sp. LW4]
MPLSFSIRPASPEDQGALLPLFEELDEFHRRIRPDLFRKPVGDRRESAALRDLIAGPKSALLVADSGNHDLLGLAVFVEKTRPATNVGRERRFVELDQLIVRSDVRLHGIGRSLFVAGRLWAKNRGVSDIEVVVWSFNQQAANFYRRLSFKPMVERLTMPL